MHASACLHVQLMIMMTDALYVR